MNINGKILERKVHGTRQTTFFEFQDKWNMELINAVGKKEPKEKNPDPDGLGSLTAMIKDIQMEEWLQRPSRCPQCTYGDVKEGKDCDTCGWQPEEEEEYRKECNYMGRPFIYPVPVERLCFSNMKKG